MTIGKLTAKVIFTPGHTPADLSYQCEDAIFIGDTLFMPDVGTARADFPGGDARRLFQSIRKLLDQTSETRLFMCHDYPPPSRHARWESTVAKQRAHNIHVRDGISEDEFVAMRKARDATLDMPTLLLPSIQVTSGQGKCRHRKSFDFLGYRFQPRCAQRRGGELFLSFLPAVSVKAGKSMRQTIRSWKTHRWTQLTIEELAVSFNPVLRGWINYYGKFYKSKLAPIPGQFDYALVRWVERKYKRLGGSPTRARVWLKRIVAQQPRLFAHWHITYAGMTER